MSVLSRCLIGVMLLGLAFVVGLRLYRSYEQTVAEQTAQTETLGQSFSRSYPAAANQQLPVFRGFPIANLPAEVYIEDAALPADLNKEQARQTLRSILADYQDNAALQSFYADLFQSTGESLDLTSLSGDNMTVLLAKYPQIQDVIAKHTQNPEFVKTLQEVFSNPQFVRSVAVLQQGKDK